MRRKDRERDSAFAYEILRDCEYATLATINADGTPYCIPISPVLIGDVMYFHCALEGQKLDNIKVNNKVCISCVRHTKLLPEIFGTEFESTVAKGICEIVLDDAEKTKALRELSLKYASENADAIDDEIAGALHKTGVCKVIIEEITGKANIS